MKIAYFTNQYPKVSHSFIRREIIELERQGFEIFRFASRGWDENLLDRDDIREQKKTRYILENGILRLLFCSTKIFLLSPLKFISTLTLAVRLGFHSSKSVAHYVVYFLESCVLLTWMQESGCSHVHVHFGTNPTQVAMFSHLLGAVNYSFTVHGPEEFDMPRFLHIKEKAEHASFIVAISSYGRSQLYRHIDYEQWSKVHIVHCGIEPSFYEGSREPVSDINRLVCVGRLCEQKGQLMLIQALHQLIESDVTAELVLAGDGEMRGEIEYLIKRCNLSEHVRITGWIDAEQVRDEILNSRAMVLPSFAEGLPVVIMEAFALHRPVISTYVAGIPELVIDGENGWLIPAGSVSLLKNALKECLETPTEKLREMGEAAYQRVLIRHSIEAEVKKITLLLRASA
jgi:colanic acid/amylovoran biosynthesis glycosyltransferase